MPLITIFTPTYNRNKLLHRLYDSLCRQTYGDFVWLIVDDGSTDGTQQVVSRWIAEGRINIRYIWQKNSGKPSATNLSIEMCDTPLWLCVDSDDILADDGIEIIAKEYQEIKENGRCCGIIGGHFYIGTGEIVGVDGKIGNFQNPIPSDIKYISYSDLVYRRKIKADKTYIYKTDILKKYRYPIIDGEKFIGQSYLYEQLGTDYVYYISEARVYYCEYQPDGLTANYKLLHIRSPKGYKLLKEQMMCYPKPLYDQFKGAIMYVAACKLCCDKHIVRYSPRRVLTLFALPFGYIAYYRKYYMLARAEHGKGTKD